MALAAETKAIVGQYDYTDEDVNKGVKEFLRQMGECPNPAERNWKLYLTSEQAKDWRRTAPA